MTARDIRPRRTADPYRDVDVIDGRAPRFNQATVGTLSLVALLTGWWWLLAALAAQLIVGLVFGRRWCLPCLFYFEVVQPRIGEGEVEDARPPRFANIVGAAFLGAAALAGLTGAEPVGLVLGGTVAALALLAAATGICVGCELYRIWARLRGVGRGRVDRIDLAEFGAISDGPVVLQFTHPLCTECRKLAQRLAAEGRPPLEVDVSRRPDLARKYHVSVLPVALAVARDGRILERIA